MAQLTMFPSKPGSPQTTITATLFDVDTSVGVAELSCFPAAGTDGNLITLYDDTGNWERCRYTAKSTTSGAGTLTIERTGSYHDSSTGGAIEWPSGTVIVRNPTSYDADAERLNIADHETRLAAHEVNVSNPHAVTATQAGASSSTTATVTLYVDKAATGTGTGLSWTNAFATIQAAVNSLPAVISHAVTIYVRKGATAYAEAVSVQRLVGLGSITIRAEYYWYGTNASSKTGKFDLGTGDTGYADRAEIEAGDTVWMTKWSGSVLASAPLESFTDTVASVDGAEVTLTTNSAKALTTAWTYQIAKTVIQSVTVTTTAKVYVIGFIISNAGAGVTLSGAILPDIRACHIASTADPAFPITISGGSAGVTITRCWLYSANTNANGIILVSSTVTTCTYNVIEITAVSGTSYGIKVIDSYVPIYYSHIKTAIIGLIAQRGGVIYAISCLNSGTTPISPANWAASTDGGVVL